VLDPQLIHFVRTSLRSIWALEVLLFVRGRAPNAISCEEIVRELRATPYLVKRIVDQLASEQLVALEGSEVRFQASSPDQEKLCELLEAASRDRPIGLRDAIVGSPDTKLKNFSDAFRITGKDKGK
jgi:hypothetical protein